MRHYLVKSQREDSIVQKNGGSLITQQEERPRIIKRIHIKATTTKY